MLRTTNGQGYHVVADGTWKRNGADCAGCAAAKADPLSGLSISGCLRCAARGLARGMAYHESAKAGQLLPAYRAALTSAFGDQWLQWHEQVKAHAAAVRAAGKAGS